MMEKTEIGDDIKLFPDFPKRDFVYIEDVVSANLYAEENFEDLKGKYYEVGSGEARTFEDVLENIGITKFHYYDKSDIPEGYQFFTESNKNKWMKGWSPKYNLEDGLKDYKLKFKFRKNRRLWIFGDSFSQSFENLFTQDVEWSKQYKKYKKENVPKVYGQLISEKTELEIINHARGGVSNDYIFHCFIEKLNEIVPGDIFIFNWTEVTRFTLSNDHNELTTVIPFAHHDPPSKYVTEKTVNEIGVNRGEYSSYWQQVNNYMKIIKSTLVDHEVYFWTWVKYEDKTPSIVWSDIFKDKILCIKNWSKSNKKTKQLFEEESDYLLDMTKIKHVDEIYELKKKYRKLYVFNVDILSNKAKFTNFSDIIWLDAEDHFNTFKNNLIPTNNYETIKEETKNKIDDLHYSEQGQKDLSEDILNYIIKQKEKENNKLILQKDSEIGYKNTKTII
jgi:hypothetical protein